MEELLQNLFGDIYGINLEDIIKKAQRLDLQSNLRIENGTKTLIGSTWVYNLIISDYSPYIKDYFLFNDDEAYEKYSEELRIPTLEDFIDSILPESFQRSCSIETFINETIPNILTITITIIY